MKKIKLKLILYFVIIGTSLSYAQQDVSGLLVMKLVLYQELPLLRKVLLMVLHLILTETLHSQFLMKTQY